ncbi:MAG TPA: helix-turn-helix domain-containing protein [Puia sp.]|nr:helix-turn-helix domain-containing protein [Puia sp.]
MTELFDDIRGIYDFKQPCELLKPYVEFISESSPERTGQVVGGAQFAIELFPSWTPTLWFNIGPSYRLTTGHGCYPIPADSDVLVLRDSIISRHNQPDDHLFSVKFHPGGLEAVLGISQTRFIGKIVRLSDILPPRLISQVKQAEHVKQRQALLEDYFLASLARRPKRDHFSQLVADSIGNYVEAGMQPNTTELACRHFVHSRTINRYFHRVIGLSPKRYLGIVRARTALASFIRDKRQFCPMDFGYYDMSHFYKGVREFMGRPLKHFD